VYETQFGESRKEQKDLPHGAVIIGREKKKAAAAAASEAKLRARGLATAKDSAWLLADSGACARPKILFQPEVVKIFLTSI